MKVSSAKPAIFFDRDGTLIEEVSYLSSVEQVSLLDRVGEAISMLTSRGIPAVVVTNQAGVARGYFPESRVAEVHERLDQLLRQYGGEISRFYYCPHHPSATVNEYRRECGCRKPAPGMLYTAAEELDLDLSRSFMIGDKLSDLQAGAAAGCRVLLVRTGYGREVEANEKLDDVNPLGVVDSVFDAVELCLEQIEAQCEL